MRLGKRSSTFVTLTLILFFIVGCKGKPGKSKNEFELFDHQEAKITLPLGEETGEKSHLISFSILKPNDFIDPEGRLYVSIEVPKEAEVPHSELAFEFYDPSEKSIKSTALKKIESPIEQLNVTFPPGPDDTTAWKTFVYSREKNSKLFQGPINVKAQLVLGKGLEFTRILLGKPSTPRSKIIGAYTHDYRFFEGEKIIKAGIDYLGTISAKQHIRIPADTVGFDTEAFDDMVEFMEAPFNPQENNVDTIMERTRDVPVGGTTPVKLVKFANKTLKPIEIKIKSGKILYYAITARLSPNAESTGFITILADGSYRSTTALYPILEFQRILDGKPFGKPIIIDTAVTSLPGFPFYLASEGGKWDEKTPVGRFVSAENSNFFYNNGDVNSFIHSNGIGTGVFAACKKASALPNQVL